MGEIVRFWIYFEGIANRLADELDMGLREQQDGDSRVAGVSS